MDQAELNLVKYVFVYFEKVLSADLHLDVRNVPCKTYRRIYNRQFFCGGFTLCGCVRSSLCPPRRGVYLLIFRLSQR
jgi:hypothetical protein